MTVLHRLKSTLQAAPQRFSSDVTASLVVFLVAIPLSLGIAAACGAPLIAGLVAAVVGGIVAGSLSGAPLLVSGPGAGVTVVIAQLIHSYGFPATAMIVALAGGVQIVLGITKLGRIALSLSPAVVHGMLAGIGIVIVIGQLHVILGGSPQTSVLANLVQLPEQLASWHRNSVLIGLVAIGLLVGWPLLRRVPRLAKLTVIPGALVAVVVTTIIAALVQLSVSRVQLPDEPLKALVTPELPDASFTVIAVAVATVALIASVESLLSAVGTDRLHDGPRANLDKELVAQGAANIVSGSLGGLPVTGAIVRSSVNVEAGAQTRLSSVLHGLWVLVCVFIGTIFLEQIPLPVLAAILIVVGVRLVDIGHVRALRQHREFPIYVITFLGVVFLNLMEGVLIGIAAALILALYRVTHCSIEVKYESPGRWRIDISGTLIFLSVGRLTRHLHTVPPCQHITVNLHTDFMDHASYEALAGWQKSYERADGKVHIVEDAHSSRHFALSKIDSQVPEGRRRLPVVLPRWLAPWSHWQRRNHRDRDNHEDHPMIVGVREFQHRAAPVIRPILSELAAVGQSPHQLFITCADSRVLPNLITTSGPGDLFCVRNVGNFVPRHGASTDDSVGASIEFGVDVLKVSSIAVCGHSDCGAMKALLEKQPRSGSHLASWLTHGEPSLERARVRHIAHSASQSLPTGTIAIEELSQPEKLSVYNVIQQLDHLASYPSVAAGRDSGRLDLIGMYLDISHAQIYLVNPATNTLHPVATHQFQAA